MQGKIKQLYAIQEIERLGEEAEWYRGQRELGMARIVEEARDRLREELRREEAAERNRKDQQELFAESPAASGAAARAAAAAVSNG